MTLFIIYLVVTIALVVYLSSKTPSTGETVLEDIDIPTAEEGRPIPRVYGTKLIKAPNIVWYGDLRKEKVYNE